MNDSAATRKVFLELQKEHPEHHMHAVWEHLMGVETSLETFRLSAVGWLGDRTELSTAEIKSADWPEVYKYFKEYSE
ncbi:hypothetical protein [Streptomyces vinaceus]|uniref:hypothetical protein n=1 Tax=Streptomyces vinaceus TaxID=1960 RepID=UPI0036B522B5